MFAQRLLASPPVARRVLTPPTKSLLYRSMGFAKKDTLWPMDKKILNVRFATLEDKGNPVVGTEEQMNQVKDAVNAWIEASPYLKFYFLTESDKDKTADVIVNFDPKIENQSKYGKQSAATAATGKWTLNVGNKEGKPADKYKADILHEFGHALGLYHEHQMPRNVPEVILISEELTRVYCAAKKVDFDVYWKQLEPLGPAADYDISDKYNNESIMRYTIPNEIQEQPPLYPDLTKNMKLSAGDIAFIQHLYKPF